MLLNVLPLFLVYLQNINLISFQVITGNKEDTYLGFFKEVVRRTAKLVAMWQCVGFCHG